MQRFRALALAVLLAGCGDGAPPAARFENLATVDALARHSEEFRRGVEQVTDGVWVAIGYGLANAILIEGPDGLIVIDTLETMEEGRVVATEFRALSTKPLRAIVYTHNHTDHVFGAQAFVDELAHDGVPVAVYAHETTVSYLNRVATEYRPILTARSFRMFGQGLDPEALVNDGIGPFLGLDENSTLGFVEPTVTVRDALVAEVAGLAVHLVHAPGETNDQLFVWLPERKVLAVGDNLYKTFPNLYTIRGTPYRSLKAWAASLDRMRALPVAHLVPSHTRPLTGRDEIAGVLRDYRDAIRYVHDQTVRWMNAGLTPDEIAERVRLPAHLASSPYLQEFYGTVEWSTRSVFAGNLGWFDGNPATLQPLPPREEAERVAGLAGGVEMLAEALDAAAARGDHQWALQLSDWVLRLDPDHEGARAARVDALIARGEAASNPNARHYYLMSALELRDGRQLRARIGAGAESTLRRIPLRSIFDGLAVSLRAEDALEEDTKVGFRFTDTSETWTLWVRRGVTEVRPGLLDALDIEAEVDSMVFKRMLAQVVSPVAAIARDFEFHVGNGVAFARVMNLFRPVVEAPVPAPFAASATR